MDLLKSLPLNILNNLNFIKQDFLGLKIDLGILLSFSTNLLLSFFIIFVSFAFGKKILKLIKIDIQNKTYSYIIFITIGYIFISLGVTLLGLFSILSPINLALYLLFIFIFSFGLHFNIYKDFKIFLENIKLSLYGFKNNKFVSVWIILFIILALFNLLTPEIREDQYHVDFARQYLSHQTIMIPPKENYHISAIPLLGEMYYIVGIFLGSKETSRYISLFFYLLVILTLMEFSKLKSYKFAIYTPLIFATAPLIIHENTSIYVDFQWLLCFLLSIFILLKKPLTRKDIILAGLLFGGMLATKITTTIYIPIPIIYLFIVNRNLNIKKSLSYIIIFIISFFSVAVVWYIRSAILTGNPFYYIFLNNGTVENFSTNLAVFKYLRFNSSLFNPFLYLNAYSPLFFVGLLLLPYNAFKNLKYFFKLDFSKYFSLLFILLIFVSYSFSRYLLGLYVLFIFLSSLGLSNIILKFKHFKYLLTALLMIFYIYYLSNTILILPYSFGISDQNKYLSRILVRDNSSYYNFDNKFDPYIKKNDLVGMYNFHGYYYADFNYIDTGFIFDKNGMSFNLLKKHGVTKLLIRSGDIVWFCKNLHISGCTNNKYELISNYLTFPNYYLYKIK